MVNRFEEMKAKVLELAAETEDSEIIATIQTCIGNYEAQAKQAEDELLERREAERIARFGV